MAPNAFRIERVDGRNGHRVMRVAGQLRLGEGGELWAGLSSELPRPGQELEIDLSALESTDGAGASLLLAARGRAIEHGATLRFTGARPEVAKLLELYGCPSEYSCLNAPPRASSMFDTVGEATVGMARGLRDILGFVGDGVVAMGRAVRAPRTIQWRDVGRLMERAGADGVAIVVLVNFLVGLIIALQASEQLKRFGANEFVADLVGIAVLRDLAPLMTAIIVAGRSGAAYAAELGTMKVSEEIDALRTLGLDPQRFLVLPRVIALTLVVPVLVLVGDVVGCLGGLFIAVSSLDLTAVGYWNQLQSAVDVWDLGTGLIKSMGFAIAITFFACQRGLATRGGAEGVGSSTTSAVVVILFHLILLDALFTVFFNFLGI